MSRKVTLKGDVLAEIVRGNPSGRLKAVEYNEFGGIKRVEWHAQEEPDDRLPSGMPPDLVPDLVRILRDPTITIPRDHEITLADGRTLFEHLQEWRNAPSNTASAEPDARTMAERSERDGADWTSCTGEEA